MWTQTLRRVDDREKKQFAYPNEVLDLIRSILPKIVKGEILGDAENLSLKEFCLTMRLLSLIKKLYK